MQQVSAVTGFDEGGAATQNLNPGQRQSQDENLQWLGEPMLGGLYPDLGDLFGQVSLEALFQESIDGEGADQWDSVLSEFP